MPKKWNIWIYKGDGFIDCMAIDSEREIFRTRISNRNFYTEKGLINELMNNLNPGESIDAFRSANIQTISKFPGIPYLKTGITSLILASISPDYTCPWIRDQTLFDHVIRVDEKKLVTEEKEVLINESEINVILRQVFEKKPDLVFMAINVKLLETTIANLLKAAGYGNIVVSSK